MTSNSFCWSHNITLIRHGMEALSKLLALCEGNPVVTGGFALRSASNAELRLFLCHQLWQLLNKQLIGWWFETHQRSCYDTVMTRYPSKWPTKTHEMLWRIITVTSWWARWLAQAFVQAQIKENIKGPRHWPLWGEIHRWPVDSPHKGPITGKMFPFDDVIMIETHYLHPYRLRKSISLSWRSPNHCFEHSLPSALKR